MVKCNILNQNKYCVKLLWEKIPSVVNADTFGIVHETERTNDDVEFIQIEESILTYFPNTFGEVFKNISCLYINNSNLIEVFKENFKQFPKLEILDLGYNKITDIPKDLFEFNGKLKVIKLNDNSIKRIESGLLDNLKDLEEFHFEMNDIEFVPGTFFKNNTELRIISLFGNKIKFIGPELLDGLVQLVEFDVKDNPCIDDFYDKNMHNPQKLKNIKRKIKFLENHPEVLDITEPPKKKIKIHDGSNFNDAEDDTDIIYEVEDYSKLPLCEKNW